MANTKSRRTTASKPQEKDASLKRLGIIAGAGVLALALIWGIVFTLMNNDAAKNADPTPTATSTSVVKTERSVTGKSLEQDKKDAIAALNEILLTADKSPTGVTAEVRLQKLDSDDYSVIDEKLPSMIHYGPDSTAGMKTSTYQSLVTLATVVKDKNPNKKIAPLADDAWTKTYGDPAIGTVFVPLTVYAGNSSAFSLEMVYVDGKWKLAPYSLIDAIRLSAALQSQG